MSASLMWRPKSKGNNLPYELRKALEKRLSLDRETTFHAGDAVTIGYLDALKDQGVKGAAELLEALLKHTEVILWLEY